MKWLTTLSQAPSLSQAIEECVSATAQTISGLGPPDLSFFFASLRYGESLREKHSSIGDVLKPKVLIGCSAGGVIGAGKEIENRPAISLTSAWLPGVKIHPFFLLDKDLPDLESPQKTWRDLLNIPKEEDPEFVVLADPFSIRVEHFLSGMDYGFPKSVKIGGLASGGLAPGENLLYYNSQYSHAGLVGVALSGNIYMDTVIAQGCRPIGDPMTITDCQGQFLIAADGKPPLQVLEKVYEASSKEDQALIRNSLFLGIGIDPFQETFEMGDFLVRNIIGVDTQKGTLGVASILRPGQIVQFHLRDAGTSSQELQHMLNRYQTVNKPEDVAGALLFSCLGRGAHLYGTPNHDSDLFSKKVGQYPLGGFFCNGEIGPIGGTTCLHGYTSSFGIFRPRTTMREPIKKAHSNKRAKE